MKLNNYLIQILKCFASLDNKAINSQLLVSNSSAILKLNNKDLVKINESSILINGKTDLEGKILCKNIETLDLIEIDRINKFIQKIAVSITELDHLGISYFCPDINQELNFYKALISNTSLKLYEEESGVKNNRWFFIGDLTNDNNPLFEIILTETKKPFNDIWVPHFQVEFNSLLDHKALIKETNSFLAKDFFKWSFNIPNYGIVTSMGFLGNINGTKITLGIGTNIRGKQSFKEII